MVIKGIIDEDFVNYKKPCMIIETPLCDFKCDKECGLQVCQNSSIVKLPNINISAKKIVDRYISNDISEAICFQGLEPMDSWEDLWELICELRHRTSDDIVIYTGYTEKEIYNKRGIISQLIKFPNIIIKFGRFIPNQKPHYDEVLGVNLASDNQYAKRVS